MTEKTERRIDVVLSMLGGLLVGMLIMNSLHDGVVARKKYDDLILNCTDIHCSIWQGKNSVMTSEGKGMISFKIDGDQPIHWNFTRYEEN